MLIKKTDKTALLQIVKNIRLQQLLFLIALLVLGSIATAATPVFFGYLIDGLNNKQLSQPVLLFCLYAVLTGSNRFISDMRSTHVRYIENDVIYSVGIEFFQKLLLKPVSLFDKQSGSSMLEIIRNMQMSFRVYVNLIFNTLLPSITEILVAVFIVGALINIYVGLLVLSYGVAIIVITHKSNQRVQPVQRKALRSLRENAFALGDACAAIRSVKLTNSENWIAKRYDMVNTEIRKQWFLFHSTRLRYSAMRSLAFVAQVALLFVISIHLFTNGQITIGELVLFNGLILQLNRPAELIATSIEEVLGGRQLREDYDEILGAADAGITDNSFDLCKLDDQANIEFKNVDFSYNGGKNVISNFSEVFQRGKINFIVGKSGKGKSTLLGLLTGFIDGYQGTIKIGGQDLSDVPINQLYKYIGFVPQSTELLNATLADNIKMGGNYSDDLLMDAISNAGLKDRVSSLEDGLETLIGRNGINLSGGEQQRISVARALIRNPKVLLLDEPSSALDEETEKRIFDQLRTLSKNVLIIAITHRTKVISLSDIVTKMN